MFPWLVYLKLCQSCLFSEISTLSFVHLSCSLSRFYFIYFLLKTLALSLLILGSVCTFYSNSIKCNVRWFILGSQCRQLSLQTFFLELFCCIPQVLVCCFSLLFIARYILFFFISSLTYWLFSNVLFNILIFVNFPVYLLFLIFNFIPLWPENILDMVLIFLNLRLVC